MIKRINFNKFKSTFIDKSGYKSPKKTINLINWIYTKLPKSIIQIKKYYKKICIIIFQLKIH